MFNCAKIQLLRILEQVFHHFFHLCQPRLFIIMSMLACKWVRNYWFIEFFPKSWNFINFGKNSNHKKHLHQLLIELPPLVGQLVAHGLGVVGSHYVTALNHPARAVGLSYHGNRIIHSRIANADILAFRIANSEERACSPRSPKSVHNSKFCWDMDTFECYFRNKSSITTSFCTMPEWIPRKTP